MNESSPPNISQLLDCLGEISNVAYGVAKIKLNENGFNFAMVLPHSSRTDDLKKIKATTKTVVPFKLYDETCYIEIVIS